MLDVNTKYVLKDKINPSSNGRLSHVQHMDGGPPEETKIIKVTFQSNM